MMDKLGLREPARLTPTLQYVFNEDTGMEYEQYKDEYDQLYMTASHEDVGQVTWFRISKDAWDELLQDSTEHIG